MSAIPSILVEQTPSGSTRRWLTKSDTSCPNPQCNTYAKPKRHGEFTLHSAYDGYQTKHDGPCPAHADYECRACGRRYYVELLAISGPQADKG